MKDQPKKSSAATIVDIARLAGVHPSTVSRVFSGKAPVKSETAEEVLKWAEELGFQINREARKLVKGQGGAKILGIVVPLFTHPFYTEILKGIDDYFNEKSLNIMLFNLGRREDEVFDRILEEGLSGILVISHRFSEEQLTRLRRARIPVVSVDQELPGVHSLIVNNLLGGRLAAKYLHQKGCKKILYVGEDFCSIQQDDRKKGFLEELQLLGLPKPQEIIIKQSRTIACESTLPLLKTKKIDGIFCFCDEMAYGVQNAFRALGRSLPLIGFDDMLPSQYLELTTIAQPAVELGYQGSQTLHNLMEGRKPEGWLQVLDPKLVIRKT